MSALLSMMGNKLVTEIHFNCILNIFLKSLFSKWYTRNYPDNKVIRNIIVMIWRKVYAKSINYFYVFVNVDNFVYLDVNFAQCNG